MKKIICIALSTLLLTACHAEEKEQQVTGTTPAETTVTTPLTLTEIITTETSFVPEEPEKKQRIELAVFDPFEDSVVVEDEVYRELSEAVEKISDGHAFLYANTDAFFANKNCKSKYYENFADTDIILDDSNKPLYVYCPLNPEVAKTEEELFELMRKIFTENLYTDDEIKELLFSSENSDKAPAYKTIDGTLCIRVNTVGGAFKINFDEFNILSYDGNRAEICHYAPNMAYPPFTAFLTLEKSEEYGWQLDAYDFIPCYIDEATLMYNAVALNTEKLNTILSGGVQPENPKTTLVDGVEYTETDTGMSLTEMQDYFAEIFVETNIYKSDAYHSQDGLRKEIFGRKIKLCEEYTEKYINAVYREIDGILYRRNDAEKWYLPEIKSTPYFDNGGVGYDEYSFVYSQQPFYDFVTGEEFEEIVVVKYDIEYNETEKLYYDLQIAYYLPIKPLE